MPCMACGNNEEMDSFDWTATGIPFEFEFAWFTVHDPLAWSGRWPQKKGLHVGFFMSHRLEIC